jgi:hypothetical protein
LYADKRKGVLPARLAGKNAARYSKNERLILEDMQT